MATEHVRLGEQFAFLGVSIWQRLLYPRDRPDYGPDSMDADSTLSARACSTLVYVHVGLAIL
jgi:hypothetical protein